MRLLHPDPRPRPHVQRRVHGAEPVRRAVALRRRPHDARRHRHDDPARRVQHDRRRRAADGRDRRPPRRPRGAAPGHPARRGRAASSSYVKSCHPVYETPITLSPEHTIGDASALIHKRAHGAVVVVDDGRPVGIFTEQDAAGFDRFTQLRQRDEPRACIAWRPTPIPHAAFERLADEAPARGAGRRRRRPPRRGDHPQGRAALDDLPAGASTPTGGC